MSLLSRIKDVIGTHQDSAARLEADGDTAAELAIYFQPAPADPVWKPVTYQNVEAVQRAFMEIWERAHLDHYHSTHDITGEVVEVAGEVAKRAANAAKVPPGLILVLAHQYIDAKAKMRELHRSHWVATMVERCSYAPAPETYADDIRGLYFAGGN